jgi:hypothetical protein
MSQGIIGFMPGFNGDSYLFVFFGLFSLQIEVLRALPSARAT